MKQTTSSYLLTKTCNMKDIKFECVEVDPEEVDATVFLPRHASVAETAEGRALRKSIIAAGGLKTPVRVRHSPDGSLKMFELLSGYMRWLICREERLQILVMVESATNAEALLLRYQDNTRVSMSGYDLGRQFISALDQGDFGSQAEIARALNFDEGWVSKLIAMGRLPEQVVDAFLSPADLQHRYVKPLTQVMQEDRSCLIARALTLIEEKQSTPRPASKIFEALLGTDESPAPPIQVKKLDLKIGNLVVGVLSLDSDRTAKMLLRGLDHKRFGYLSSLLEDFCAGLASDVPASVLAAGSAPRVKAALRIKRSVATRHADA